MKGKGAMILGLVLAAGSASAVLVVTTGDSYRYIDATAATTFGGSTAGWETLAYDDSGWFAGNAVFGNSGAIESNPVQTQWDAQFDPKLRKIVTLGTTFSQVTVRIAVDNGFDLYVNGTLVGSANAEGYTNYWEYEFDITPGLLTVGNNIIAVQLEDHGGATAFDMEIEGVVPEPASMAALGMGALALLRRRRRK